MLALALDLHLEVEAREASKTTIEWRGEGSREVPVGTRNLIYRAMQDPFRGWSRPLPGVQLRVHNHIPLGRGLGGSAAAIVAGIMLGARLRRLRMTTQRTLELGFPLEGHGDNLAAALLGGLCVVAASDGGVRVHRLDWPARWRVVLFVPHAISPTHEARRLVPARPARTDAVFNLARMAEWILACTHSDGTLLASAMQDRLHQPGRSRAYPYLDDAIEAALEAGALGAALSGAGGSVIAVVDRKAAAVSRALVDAAKCHRVNGTALIMRAAAQGAAFRS